MANPEHVAILKQGVEVWNEWRENSRNEYADLSGVDLSGETLRGVDFWFTNLRNSNLRMTNLSESHMHWTWLNNSDLYNSFLINADFIEANLYAANLRQAQLHRTRFEGGNLHGADFTEAVFAETLFVDTDLSNAKGLENGKHIMPSTLGIDTIYRSGGNIPEVFLRGCGVPDTFINFSRSLIGKPIEFYSCFISYSSKDQEFAEHLHADLQSKGVRVWFAPDDLKIGDKFRMEVDRAIRIYDKLLIVLSENSITSPWVEKEVETAFEKERRENRIVLFPIRLDDSIMKTDQAWAADIRRTRHIGDFSRWKNHDSYQAALERLLRDLKAAAPGG